MFSFTRLNKCIPWYTYAITRFFSTTSPLIPAIIPRQALRTLQLLKDTNQSGLTSLQILDVLPQDTITLTHLRAVVSNVASDKMPLTSYLVSGMGASIHANPAWLSCVDFLEKMLPETALSVEEDLAILRDLATLLNSLLGEGIDYTSPIITCTLKMAVKLADRAGSNFDALSVHSQPRGPALVSQTLLALLELFKYHRSLNKNELRQIACHPFVSLALKVIPASLSLQNTASEWAGYKEGPRTLFTACAALKRVYIERHLLGTPALLSGGYWEKILIDVAPLVLISIEGEMGRLQSLENRGSSDASINANEMGSIASSEEPEDARLHEGVADLLQKEGLVDHDSTGCLPVELMKEAATGHTGRQYRSTLFSLRALRAAVDLCAACYPDAQVSPTSLFRTPLDLLSSLTDPQVHRFLSAGSCLSLGDLAACHLAALDTLKFSKILHAAMNDFSPDAWTPKSLIDTLSAHSAVPSGSAPIEAIAKLNNAALKLLAKGASGKSGVLFTPRGIVEVLDGFMRTGVRTPSLALAFAHHYTTSAALQSAFPPALLAAFFTAMVGHGVRLPSSLGAVLPGALSPTEIVGKSGGVPTAAIDILHALTLSGLAGEDSTGTWMGAVMHSILHRASEVSLGSPSTCLYKDHPRAAVRLRAVLETFEALVSVGKDRGNLKKYKELNLERQALISLSWTNQLLPWGRLSPRENWSDDLMAIAKGQAGPQKVSLLLPPFLPYFQRLDVELSQAVTQAAARMPESSVEILASKGKLAFYSPTAAVSGESLYEGKEKKRRFWTVIFVTLPPPAFLKVALDDVHIVPQSSSSVCEVIGVSNSLTLLSSHRLGLLKAVWKGLLLSGNEKFEERSLHIVKVPYTLWGKKGGVERLVKRELLKMRLI